MPMSRTEIDQALAELAAWVPSMLSETDEGSHMDAFAGRAELIEDQAGPDDVAYVHDRLQQILSDNCMVPSDEGPCA